MVGERFISDERMSSPLEQSSGVDVYSQSTLNNTSNFDAAEKSSDLGHMVLSMHKDSLNHASRTISDPASLLVKCIKGKANDEQKKELKVTGKNAAKSVLGAVTDLKGHVMSGGNLTAEERARWRARKDGVKSAVGVAKEVTRYMVKGESLSVEEIARRNARKLVLESGYETAAISLSEYTEEAVELGIFTLRVIPVPGLAPFSELLAEAYDSAQGSKRYKLECLQLTERYGKVLISIIKAVRAEGNDVAHELAEPLRELMNSFRQVSIFLERQKNVHWYDFHRNRDEMEREIAYLDKSRADAVQAFDRAVYLRTLKKTGQILQHVEGRYY